MRTLVPPCRGWKRLTAAVCAGLMAGAVSFLPVVEGHPVLDSKGTAVSISGTANMNITSTAANNVIKWVDFSIGENEKVAFDAHNYLNYVTGSARSDIYGTLTGGGAVINVGSLYLSSKEMNANGFAAFESDGSLVLNGNAKGDVINMGKLNADVITVEGNNITFKNVADVTKGGSLSGSTISGSTVHHNGAVKLTANGTGEIHIGSETGAESGYTTSGATYNYKLVHDATELQTMQDALAGNYMLAGNIDMSGFSGFTPIGFTPLGAFTGRFDGLNYQIQNLTFESDKYNVGLFGINKGVIENVGLVDGSVTGKTTAPVGGLVGWNWGGTIRNVYNTGSVTGEGTTAGHNYVGGIVAYNQGTVERAYNTGTVTGTQYVGGIIGYNSYGNLLNGYSKSGVASGSTDKNDTVGENSGTTSNVAAVSEAALKQAATFEGFGFTDGVSSDGVWRIYEGSTMPLLTAFLTRKDNDKGTTTYNGTVTGDVGARYAATTYSGAELQIGGANYIKDVSIVKPKDLTVSFDASPDKIYDGTTNATAGTGTLTGKVEGDDVSLATGVTANYEDKNAGTNKQVNYTNVALTGDAAKNYNLTNAATVTGTGTITPKDISATFANISKTYDGGTTATAGAGSLTGVVSGDTVTVSGTAAFGDKNVGTNKTVNYTGVTLSGTDAGNYTLASTTATGTEAQNYCLTQTSVNADNGTITRKALSLVADPVSITQGAEIPESFTGNLTGFVAGEGLAEGDEYAFALEGTPDALGSYAVWGKLKVGDSNPAEYGDYGANYTFANAASNATAFTIKAKPAPVPVTPGGSDTPNVPDTPAPNDGTLAERVRAEIEARNRSLATVTELENAAEVAKEQPFAKDMAAVAEMGAVEANTPSPASSDSGHTYTLLPGGLVAARDDVNSATASAVMGGKANSHSANEVVEAAEQADLAIGTEEVYNRQDNNASGENSDEEDKKQSE